MTDDSHLQPLNVRLAPAPFRAALLGAWSRESCWKPVRHAYPTDGSNPAFGNCLVTVLSLWAEKGFKGDLSPVTYRQPDNPITGWHFDLRQDGKHIDLTRQQFETGTKMHRVPTGSRQHMDIIRGSIFDIEENKSLRQRLGIFLSNMETKGNHIVRDADGTKLTADEIVDRAERHVASTRPPRGPVSLSRLFPGARAG